MILKEGMRRKMAKIRGNKVATIIDVAKMAGVSISTVSRVINNKDGVSEGFEEKIKSAIEKLKYKPNTVARALKAKTTKSLGLIVPSIENAIFPSLIKVIEDTAKKYGFSTILCNSDGNVEEEARYLQLLVEKQVDGIIFNAMGIYNKGFEIVKDAYTPIIVVGKKIEGFKTSNVSANNFHGAYMAVEYLIKSGMRNIAFLFGQLEAESAISNRFEGYKAALRDNNIEFKEELVIIGKWSFEGGINSTAELLSKGVKFDSVFASNDMIAIGCIEKLLDSGFSIPDDISVIGYDGIPVSQMIRPHLSTVHSPVRELGVEAVKTILRIIYTKQDKFLEKTFEPELIIRNTTKNI
jgi:LacI family transcriptional regulator